ncbi:MAG: ABC transporter permease subunit [Thermoleophilia bacterium]|nr:ABC transporter permease subunit [Thermoleophilia bacterium]
MREDLVLFRYMRGLFWACIVSIMLLATPLVVLVTGITLQFTGPTSATYQEIGTTYDLTSFGLGMLILVSPIVALLFGTTAGSIDHQSGVLRDLVLTGRSRIGIVLRRIGAAAVWVFGSAIAALMLIFVIALVLAPADGPLRLGDLAQLLGPLAIVLTTALLLGAGLALLIGSRGPAIGAFFVFELVIDNILQAIPKVGDVWTHVSLGRAVAELIASIDATIDRPVWQPVIVLVGWCVVPLALGIWRLSRREL